jgi:protein-S-isoprenylcysteine O-methyltransferase Ste14
VTESMTNTQKTPRRSSSTKGDRRADARRPKKRPRLGFILALVVTLFVVVSVGVAFLLPLPFYVPVPQAWAVVAGIILLLLGFVVLTNAFQALGFARAFGRELYATEKESRLVTVGFYAYTRNPIYLGAILLLFGWFFITRFTVLLIMTLLFLVLFYLLAKWEGAELSQRFGAEYEQYRAAVPFFIPHPRLRKHRAETPTGRRRQPAPPASLKRRRATTEHKRRK